MVKANGTDDTTSEIAMLSQPAQRALTAAGLTTLDAIARQRTADLLAMHGVGPKTIRQLRDALAERGLTFADER